MRQIGGAGKAKLGRPDPAPGRSAVCARVPGVAQSPGRSGEAAFSIAVTPPRGEFFN
jgi:hypothetical protein